MLRQFAGEAFGGAVIVLFERDDAARGARALDDKIKSLQKSRRLFFHQLLVDAKQRLAFRAVDDDGSGPAPQFDVGREAGAAGPHYPSL
ncbi:hypothetical protein SDC9_206622 [bioreactor metagenome]|uniref:Uncharacterized protein n=1 Tax=bioreactor metagenome TaxID=1076179 RepID=A0A645J623_9ZZZZ